VLLFLTILVQGLTAQNNLELLSAKERIRVAENEKIEAATDIAFQQHMSDGHSYFSKKHYLKAIHSYQKAAEVRPFNVYPKVKISDIELSMKDTLELLRAAEKEKPEQPLIEQNRNETEKAEPKLPETPEETMTRLDNWEQKEREKRKAEREKKEGRIEEPQLIRTTGDVPILTKEEYRIELGKSYPNGITETISKEGNKTITTRIVVKSKTGDEYKKVEHEWGGIFYFKNGDAVTERTWEKETQAK